jgi:hypothetical protein
MTPTEPIDLSAYLPQVTERDRMLRDCIVLLRLVELEIEDFESLKARLEKTSADVLRGILDTCVIQEAIAVSNARRRAAFGIRRHMEIEDTMEDIKSPKRGAA